jgi:hypothetical protein
MYAIHQKKRKRGDDKKKKVEGQITPDFIKGWPMFAYSIQDSKTLLISMNKNCLIFSIANKPHLPTLNPCPPPQMHEQKEQSQQAQQLIFFKNLIFKI